MKRKIFWICLIALSCLITGTYISNRAVKDFSAHRIHTSAEALPGTEVGLLLGTSRYNRSGGENLYFSNRISAAADLYRSGRIKHVLVSGDNAQIEYNEPQEMRQALIQSGVPDSSITLDYAGFRTYDSVIRARKVFGQEKLIIISQRFHLERAIYIAIHENIDAVGYEATGVPAGYSSMTVIREWFARVKALLDVHILKPGPRFLGEPITIPVK